MVTKRVRDESGKFVKNSTDEKVTPEEKDDILPAGDVIAKEKQRLNDEEVSEFLGEPVKDNKVVEEKEEPKKEEPKVEEKPKVEEEEINLDEFKREIAEGLKKETDKEIEDKLTKAGIKPTQAQKDKYEEYSEKFAKEKGRNPTWFELVPFIKEEVKAELLKDQQTQLQKSEEEKKKISEVNTQRQKAFDTYIDEQLNELHASGKIDKNNQDQRKALFKTMLEVNQARVKEGKTPIYSVKEIFYEHYKPPTTQPAGADAPISVGRGSTQTADNKEYSYADIHKPSFFDLFKRKES